MSAEEARQMEKTLYKIGKLAKTNYPFMFISMSESDVEADMPKIELVTNIDGVEKLRAIMEVTQLMMGDDDGYTIASRRI